MDGSTVLGLHKVKYGNVIEIKRPKVLYGVPYTNREGTDNIEQMYFMDDFFDEDIYLQVITGDAGTGKNFISALAGLYEVRRSKNKKVVYTRDPTDMGRNLGFLPGDLSAKVDPYVRPIRDTILSLNKFDFNYEFSRLISEKFLEIVPVQTLRGGNIRAIGIFDECQNEDVETVKGYISRFETPGSKVILLGSFKQIDIIQNRKDLRNSGLYHVLHAFRGWNRYSHIHLVDNMRGDLAREVDLRLPFSF